MILLEQDKGVLIASGPTRFKGVVGMIVLSPSSSRLRNGSLLGVSSFPSSWCVFDLEVSQLVDDQLAYETWKAKKVIESRDISYAFTNLLANDYYSFSKPTLQTAQVPSDVCRKL